MGSGALVVLVLVAADGPDGATTSAMSQAAADALGVEVQVRTVPSLPDDAAAERLARDGGARALVEIGWDDDERLHARVRVHLDGAPRWSERALGFGASDSRRERGRALGFVLASMLPERVERDAVAPAPTAPWPAPADAVRPAPSPGEPGRERFALAASALGAAAVAGAGGGVGASASAEWSASPWLALRAGVGFRAGDIPRAKATTLTVLPAAGVALRSRVTMDRRFGVGARADILGVWQAVSHYSSDDPAPAGQARWLLGVDALGEGTWQLARGTAIVVAAGAEASFGETAIRVAGAEVARVAAVRAVGELGLRASF